MSVHCERSRPPPNWRSAALPADVAQSEAITRCGALEAIRRGCQVARERCAFGHQHEGRSLFVTTVQTGARSAPLHSHTCGVRADAGVPKTCLRESATFQRWQPRSSTFLSPSHYVSCIPNRPNRRGVGLAAPRAGATTVPAASRRNYTTTEAAAAPALQSSPSSAATHALTRQSDL